MCRKWKALGKRRAGSLDKISVGKGIAGYPEKAQQLVEQAAAGSEADTRSP